jgi:hypothetical protein
MTAQLIVQTTFEQNLLELGSVESSKASTPAFLSATLEKIGIELSNDAHVHADKFSSISVQPMLGTLKNFVTAPEDVVKSVEETANPEVSIPVEEIKNEILPVTLSQYAITVLEDHSVSERIKKVFTEVSEKIEVLETPAESVTLGFEWLATLVELVSHHAGAIAYGLEEGAAFLGLFGLVAKVNKACQIILECQEEGAELPEFSKLASLGFSLAESLCKTLYGLSHIGFIPHAVAAVGRLNLIGAIFYLVVALISLGDNIVNYKDATHLLKALFNAAVAIAIIVLIAYTVSHLNILLLILGTGIFILNVAVSDEEEHEVKQVH